MPRLNKTVVPLVAILCCVIALSAAAPQQTQTTPQQNTTQGQQSAPPVQGQPSGGILLPPDPNAPANQQTQQPQQPQQQGVPQQQQPQHGQAPQPEDNGSMPQQAPANQPSNTVQVPQQPGQVQQEGGGFIIRKNVEEVKLNATVVDDRQRIVTDLAKDNFQIFENGQPQKITSFRREDVPVAVGIVIDNSGTMRDKRPAVSEAAVNLIKASNPQDEVFVVNFNSDPYLDQDFTGDTNLLKEALDRIDSRGGTALYDAVVAAADHLMKAAKLDKKVILVVTDGEDNASRESLENAVRKVSVDGGPTVYAIGLLGGEKEKRARRALRILAEQTGGVAFFPRDLTEVDQITREVAHDIRNQYVLQYAPSTAKAAGGYRTVRVEARAPGYKRLQVRTRTGYYANEGPRQQASAAR